MQTGHEIDRSLCRAVRGAALGLSVGLALVMASGCAPKQVVPLSVSPVETTLYLDGERVEGRPAELRLRSDRDHKLFFKAEGYRSELVVLRRTGDESKPRLEPGQVTVRLAPAVGRAEKGLEIELEEAP